MLVIFTPNRYSMGVAIEILRYLDDALGARIPNRGWKNGFGLEIAVGIPIELDSLSAILVTDGPETTVKRTGGSKTYFDSMCKEIENHLSASYGAA